MVINMFISKERAEYLYSRGIIILIISDRDEIEWSMHEDIEILDTLSSVLGNAYTKEEIPSLKFKAVARVVGDAFSIIKGN
ncbi:hypothetical protein [Marinomonas phage CB5A]